MKLSRRAWEILILIDEMCISCHPSQEGRFWVPGDRFNGRADYCNALKKFLNIHGSGDAKIFMSLIEKGLIVNPSRENFRYAGKITELGRSIVKANK